MLDDKLHAELAHLLTATLRDRSLDRRALLSGDWERACRPRTRASSAGTLTGEWKWFRGAGGDAANFDRFLAWVGVVIECTACRRQIDPVDVLPVVERGEDPRDLDWLCERCEENRAARIL